MKVSGCPRAAQIKAFRAGCATLGGQDSPCSQLPNRPKRALSKVVFGVAFSAEMESASCSHLSTAVSVAAASPLLLLWRQRGVCVASRKRQRRHYDQQNGGGERKISRREAGRATLEALKPSPMEVLLTLDHDSLDGESLGLCCVWV